MEAENSKRLATWLKRSAHVPLLQQEPPPTPEDAASSTADHAPSTPEETPKERRATRQSSARSSARSSSLVRPLASLSEIKAASGSGRPRTTSTRSSSREPSLKLPAPAPSINSHQVLWNWEPWFFIGTQNCTKKLRTMHFACFIILF